MCLFNNFYPSETIYVFNCFDCDTVSSHIEVINKNTNEDKSRGKSERILCFFIQ